MNIVVLMKEVPDTSAPVSADASGTAIQTDGLEYVINPYDEYAIEEALKIKADKGGEVILVSAGPESSQKTIRKALAMGADRAVLIQDAAVEGADTVGIARMLAKAIEGLDANLVLCGREASDHGGASVGGSVAELLGWPHASDVVQCEMGDGSVVVHAERDGGHSVLDIKLPALLTAQKGLNEPRYASMKGIMQAKRKKIEVKSVSDLGLDADAVASTVKVTALSAPPAREKSLRLFESAEEAVKALTEELKIV